ncbi:putative F-box/LRR-repeat protein At5g41840 [Cornus florida]|uniref:putative F-box/LRR-repeat protein At5g41840 n=1 Tax=Cornus florida TaxID=4283 RepID=UPI0028983C12|nr:putative F-box/LRR-repeat protein At5g41840 [Cornus florida]
MGSVSNRGKLIKIKRSEEDRISNLPSSLIGHILSFLPTEDVVKTSVLSTKWKYHWTSITNFYSVDRTPFGRRRNNCDQSVKSFINFVYRVLLQSVSDMRKFHLRCGNKCDSSHFNQWISIAILRQSLTIDNDSDLYMYKVVFNTPNVQYLKYFDDLVAEGYSVNNFNSLVKADKKLVLTGEFGRGDHGKELVRGISKVQRRLYFGARIEVNFVK